MPKNKINVLIDTFHLLTSFTGMKTYTIQLCEGLEKYPHPNINYVIVPDWRLTSRIKFFKNKHNIIKKVVNHLSFFLWKQLFLPIYIIFKRVDVIICTDYVLPYYKFGARSMVVIHDTLYWEYKENYNPNWRKYYTGMAEAGLDKETIVLATSEYTASKIKSVISDKHPTEVVYQSPNQLANYNKESTVEEIISKYELKNQKYFLHVGTFDKRKNLSTLLRAFKIMIGNNSNPSYKLVLVGAKGVEKSHDDFENIISLVDTLEIKDNVILTGFVKNEELSALYSNAYAYVFPSIEEGFGIPVLEAMSFNIPVIISNRGSLNEIAGDAAIVYDAENPEDLALKMQEITDPALRTELINKGKQRVAIFSQEVFVDNINAVIQKYVINK